MAYNIMRDALEHTIKRRRRDKWMKAISGMAAVVVFCTTYALILPAITMEQEPVCGIEEHVHTDECYELPKELTCDSLQSKVTVVHHHDEFCYNAAGELICSLPEVEAHTHTDECYETIVPQEPHTHTDECWETTQICEIEEHTHTEECLDEEGNVVCGKEEHTHGEGCVEKKAVCGMTEATAEELAAYAEGTVTKLVCGKTEIIPHTHSDLCYDSEGHLVCGMKEVLVHQHSAECLTETTDPKAEPVLVCTKTEHEHTDECFNTADVESPIDWEITLPDIADKFAYADNLVAVAESQLGYHESVDNTKVGADGTIYGYTRYGQWAETPYGEWSLHFLDFCLHYAGIPAEAFPVHEGQARWSEQLKEENWNIYWTPAQYEEPVPGDIVYLDLNLDGKLDAAAIVKEFTAAVEAAEGQEAQKAVVTVIQGAVPGESSKEVALMKYDVSDAVILGYASLDSAMTRYEIMNPAFGLEEEEEVEEAPAALYYCGQTEHTHGAACYDEENNLICEIPEHTHSDACAVPQPSYRCGLTEHEHDEYCRDNEGNLLCKLEEHKHDASCIAYYICGQAAHRHTEECYDENGELTCTVPEHTHDASCILFEQTVDAKIITEFAVLDMFNANKPTVTVTGILPEGATITAVPLEEEDERVLFAYNITIYDVNGNEFEPVVPVQVTFSIPGVTDNPNLEMEAFHRPSADGEQGPGEQTPINSHVGEDGSVVVDVPHFSDIIVYAAEAFCDCELNDYMKHWIPVSNDYPFGGAQNFNLFVLGDLEGWNAIHGNSAIGGNILGNHNTTPGYDEHSNFDYEANITPENDVAFLLRGEIRMSVPVVVANGNVLVKDYVITQEDAAAGQKHQIELHNEIRPSTHIHKIQAGGPYDLFDEYFAAAGMPEAVSENMTLDEFRKSEHYAGSLIEHNDHIYRYAMDLQVDGTDGHLGLCNIAGDASHPEDDGVRNRRPGALESSGLEWIGRYDYVLHGDNPFYNVFNVYSDDVAPLTEQSERNVFLDIPYGSYVMVNFIGGSEQTRKTEIENMGIQFWYKDSEGDWSQQPAKIKSTQAADYNQSQMVLFNFAPDIERVEFKSQSGYFYASVLAPNVDLYAHGLNLHGTIVFENMYGDGNNNIVYSPFFTGATIQLKKETYCDTPNEDHSHLSESGYPDKECQIDVAKNGDYWSDYFVDVKFNYTDVPGKPGHPAIKRGLPMDGLGGYDAQGNRQDWFTVTGLVPGYYSIEDELVYVKATNGMTGPDFKERRLTVDEDGYYMVALYLKRDFVDNEETWVDDPSANNWRLVYCDKVTVETVNGHKVYTCSIDRYSDNWHGPEDTEWREQQIADGKLVQANEDDFYIFKHHWNYAAFKKGPNGNEELTITVQSNPEHPEQNQYYLANHYSLSPRKNVTVYKSWGQWKDVAPEPTTPDTPAVIDDNGHPGQEWFPEKPPMGAKIGATLLWSDNENGPYTAVPSDEMDGQPNPIFLNDGNEWDGMWTNLPEEKFYKVEESVEWPGYTYNGAEELSDGYWVLRNIAQPVTVGTLTVNKRWANSDGSVMSAEDIAKQNPVTVSLYRRQGEARYPYDITNNDPLYSDPANAPFTRAVNIMIDGIGDAPPSLYKTLYYTTADGGSDLEVEILFWVQGQYNSGNEGGVDKMRLTSSVPGSTCEVTVPSPVNSVAAGGYGWCSQIKATAIIPNATSAVTLTLKGPPTQVEEKPDGLPSGTTVWPLIRNDVNGTVRKPLVTLDVTRYDPQSIQWEDYITYYDPHAVDATKPSGTQNLSKEPASNWTFTWSDLPLFSPDDEMIRYGYYVVENPIPDGFTAEYVYSVTDSRHDGSFINSWGASQQKTPPKDHDGNDVPAVSTGYITIRNTPAAYAGDPLPMTGGIGTTPYTFGGLLAASAAFFLLQYNSKKRRKEDDPL